MVREHVRQKRFNMCAPCSLHKTAMIESIIIIIIII